MTKWFSMAAVLVAVACGGSERPGTARGASARDGIAALTPTRIDTLRDEQGEFFSPSYTSLVLTRAGNVVALDQDDKRLVVFDSTGRQRYRVGRNGAGPGEFRFPRGIFVLAGDSIAVWDAGLRRLSFFDAALKFDRTEQFPRWDLDGVDSELVGRLADGRWVARFVAHGPFTDPALGARLAVDTARLMVGRSDEVPVEFQQLPLRTGVDVVLRTGSSNYNIFKLRLQDLNVSVGAVCEHGAMLVDSGGVRMLDATGRVVSASPLPRAGDTIRTAAERRTLVSSHMYGDLNTAASAGHTRALLEQLVGKFNVRMLRPSIDVSGRLWYDRNSAPHLPPSVVDRVDSAGQPDASVMLDSFGGSMQIGTNSVAMMQYGSDTTGSTVTLVHFPARFTTNVEGRLGRCFSSFIY